MKSKLFAVVICIALFLTGCLYVEHKDNDKKSSRKNTEKEEPKKDKPKPKKDTESWKSLEGRTIVIAKSTEYAVTHWSLFWSEVVFRDGQPVASWYDTVIREGKFVQCKIGFDMVTKEADTVLKKGDIFKIQSLSDNKKEVVGDVVHYSASLYYDSDYGIDKIFCDKDLGSGEITVSDLETAFGDYIELR